MTTTNNNGPGQLEQIAERMFNAYNEQGPNPWKTFDGRDVPRWSEITDQVRLKWTAAAAEAWNTLAQAWNMPKPGKTDQLYRLNDQFRLVPVDNEFPAKPSSPQDPPPPPPGRQVA